MKVEELEHRISLLEKVKEQKITEANVAIGQLAELKFMLEFFRKTGSFLPAVPDPKNTIGPQKIMPNVNVVKKATPVPNGVTDPMTAEAK